MVIQFGPCSHTKVPTLVIEKLGLGTKVIWLVPRLSHQFTKMSRFLQGSYGVHASHEKSVIDYLYWFIIEFLQRGLHDET